jgi:hypothetical protein
MMYRGGEMESKGFVAIITRIGNIASMVIASVLLLAPTGPINADTADDEYRKAMVKEAKKLEYLKEAKKEIDKSIKQEEIEKKSASTSKKKILPLSGFEENLKIGSKASYKLYIKLNTQQRINVYNVYRETNKFSEAKRKIVNEYLGI